MMEGKPVLCHPGILAALGAALLFGVGTPLAKGLLLASVDPWLLAGVLYLGSGLGLSGYRWLRRAPKPVLSPSEWLWLSGAIAAGGVVGPVLLMLGLAGMPATGASLLLNAEGVFTTLLAWFVFQENFDRRIALGMAAIVAGAMVLSWPDDANFSGVWPALAVLGACLAWGIDNNLTRKVALTDATWIAAIKGLVAGGVNLVMAALLGATWPSLPTVAGTLVVGFFAYGVSLVLFVIGLRQLGVARTGAYFSVAPFFGAVLAIPLLHETASIPLWIAGTLMAFGVWLHLTEQHDHPHLHEAFEHEHAHAHAHAHDEHHRHAHDASCWSAGRHCHRHRHEPLTHAHPHFPDAHHRHVH